MKPTPGEVVLDACTVTFTSPGEVAAGIVAVISVEDTPFTLVAGVAPKLTADMLERLVPMMVAVPPPASGDESGVIDVIVGPVGAVYV
jgi:hypothetical protein